MEGSFESLPDIKSYFRVEKRQIVFFKTNQKCVLTGNTLKTTYKTFYNKKIRPMVVFF
jgi:hypothetical protein